ncbi:MAG: bacillithiol biosynthesis BshC, partial [Candidatus Thorarchaeota archaeon]|nr:bacillithiol biosynthesis BshC [Candidatus Thorarchaeota archaeon]
MNPSVTSVYEEYIWSGKYPELARKLYSSPPKKFVDISERIPALLQKYSETGWFSEERNKKLRKALLRVNQELGALTPRVRSNIENLHHGAIESAHQSVVIGGPSFILNKAATAERIATINSTQEFPLSPYFCIADYDIVQNELTHIRTPLMGSGGTIVSIPIPKGFEFSPVSIAPLPEYQWLEQVEADIRFGYRTMFKALEGSSRRLFEERLERVLTIIRTGFINSETLGSWATRILADLFNLEGNLGIPILPASDPEIRNLWALGMELLLQKDVREKFLQVHNASTDLILENGF